MNQNYKMFIHNKILLMIKMNGPKSIPVEEKYSSRCLEAAPFQKPRTPCSQKSPQRTAWT